MIDNFLRPPRTVGLLVADGVRAIALLSVIVVAVWWTAVDVAVLALALPATLAARFLGIRGGIDAALGAAVLLAAWSSVLDLYERIAWWDVLVHFVCTGALAMLAYVALDRARVLREPREARLWTVLVLTVALGLALSAVWEIAEWLGHTFVSQDIYVAYGDTIGDMAAGGAGAAVGGLVLGRVRLLER
ncbi:MAG: hypothetical protein EOO67_01325 [Microbacterium sp.]|nr:MAG: hypothetical protein EOO67_01325 [Microbacterium sp.]